MEPNTIQVSTEDFKKMLIDLEIIKAFLFAYKQGKDPEGELSDWAKQELAEARASPDSEYISHKEIGEMLLGK